MIRAGVLAFFFWFVAGASAGEPVFVIGVEPAEIPQGGVLQLSVSGKDIVRAKSFANEREIGLAERDGFFSALWGADLEQTPRIVHLIVQMWSRKGEEFAKAVPVSVTAKDFPSENFSVPAHFDQLDAATLKRIAREREQLERLWNVRTRERLWLGRFIAPVPGAINSPFGLRRVINGAPRAPHVGVDLKAALGSEIMAANTGRVVLMEDFFFSGKSLVLDHGDGLYTMYFHLSEFRTKKNSLVRKGEAIGSAGMTGRVTGPHLHWGARLNGARIDPMELLRIQEEAADHRP